MGYSLFNPPEPCGNPHRDCGHCTGVPCKWLLRLPTYAIVDGSLVHVVPAVDLLLARIGKTGCHWGLMVGPNVHPESTQNHPLYRAWRLSYGPSVNVGSGPFGQPGFIGDWVVWIAGRQTLDPLGVGGDTVYYRKVPLNPANHPGADPVRHFACLGENRFYYWQAFNDKFADGPGPPFGWPNELTVIPWYGKEET